MRKLKAALLAFALLVLPVASHAGDFYLGLQGGAVMPTGDFADIDAQTGYLLGGFGEYSLNDMWVLGANFSMAKNNHKDVGEVIDLGGGSTYTLDEDKYTTTQFGVHTKVMIPTAGQVKPFGILGIGMTSFKEEWTETFTSGGSSSTQSGEAKADTKFGGKLGAGAAIWMNPMWGLAGEIDYNYVSEEGGSLTYVGFRASAMVKIPTAAK